MIIDKIMKFIKLILFTAILLNISGCGIYKPVDARKTSPNVSDRIQKNIKEGRGYRILGGDKNNSGVFEFASSNPMWRASIKLLEFTPLSNVDYSGGMIITDWFSDEKTENIYTKITVKFFSNEVRADGVNVIIYKKTCDDLNRCKTSKVESSLADEIKLAILKEAALIENDELTKRPDYKGPDFGTK
tara:strand:+ start:763 stop:1326 length:564 start_codon:yes stop_codon:yes gene_type:complete